MHKARGACEIRIGCSLSPGPKNPALKNKTGPRGGRRAVFVERPRMYKWLERVYSRGRRGGLVRLPV